MLQEALAAAREIEWEDARAKALAGLSPHLPEALREQALREALATAREIEWEDVRAKALAGLSSHLPEALREQALREALAAAWETRWEDDRAEALAGLAPHLPEPLLREALTVARDIGDAYARALALADLASHVVALTRPAIARLWARPQDGLTLLHFLARRSCRDLLSELRALAPVLAALGGQEAILETFRAIQDVGRWWP